MASISLEIQRNRDRISNIPDNLRTHILYFLSTKDAVKTSALSTSWNQQWTLVPVIRFDDKPRCSQSFVNIVDRVLLYNVTPLDIFQLPFGVYEVVDISNWISVVVSRHVRQINIRAAMPTDCCLPDSLYSSKTLVVLKLKGNFVFRVPEIISLVSLKIFHYEADHFEFSDNYEESDGDNSEESDGDNSEESDSDNSDVGDNSEVGGSISRLVSRCPVLEELQIKGQLENIVNVLNISSLVLKRLILRDLYEDDDWFHEFKLVLNTPNLQYLELNEYGMPGNYHLNTLHCLDTARFSVYLCHLARSWAELVLAISNVRALYLLQDFENMYSTELPNFELPKFDRLSYLELGLIDSDEALRLLIAFLQSSRQLESLSFYLECPDETWDPPTDVPFCMIYNLKVVKVDYFKEQEPLLSVLTYFLEKTNCLEELILRPQEKKMKNEEFIKKVSMLPRASNSCQIVLT